MTRTSLPGIYIRGIGVIGWPLASLLLLLQGKLGKFQVYVEPYRLKKSEIPTILSLVEKGGIVVDTEDNRVREFFPEFISKKDALEKSAVLCDCSPPGVADSRIEEYDTLEYSKIQMFVAQGSEHRFGPQFLYPDARKFLDKKQLPRFLHVSTCNTHTLAGTLRLLIEESPDELGSILEEADFLVIRRDADMAKDDPHVTGPLLVKPEAEWGTHHSRLLNELYSQIGTKLPLTSSSVTINSPYMHLVRFRFRLKKNIPKEIILRRLRNDPYLSTTELVSTNSIFSSGRDRGLYGRIFSHAVILLGSLEILKKEVRGYAATPGDSNVHISTIYAVFRGLGIEFEPVAESFLQNIVLQEI
ncbi:hypothetical protein [Leptospira weilii]|uniref:Uncharacterized protein n=1 Tax=Leptospira weilii str. UI 13098 TaxID=1088542 RepID=M6Q2D1_9LEPT|nr:hypothetical protein [Leptospira weilii]EMN89706.1 hypothetical protein LEP1GSC108_2546 [Leptospira weilii str. UI 13098]OMI18348.1 hypothetical protein BUQ74_05520 [Leptospira weilii serovar Heyan]UPY78194.1 hypothetical protein FH581_004805 [Leptospira weilii]